MTANGTMYNFMFKDKQNCQQKKNIKNITVQLLHFHTQFLAYITVILMSHLSTRQLQSSFRTQRWNIFFMNWHFRVIIPPISPRQAQWQFMKTLSCSHWCCTQHSLFFFCVGRKQQICLKRSKKCGVTAVCNASSFWV